MAGVVCGLEASRDRCGGSSSYVLQSPPPLASEPPYTIPSHVEMCKPACGAAANRSAAVTAAMRCSRWRAPASLQMTVAVPARPTIGQMEARSNAGWWCSATEAVRYVAASASLMFCLAQVVVAAMLAYAVTRAAMLLHSPSWRERIAPIDAAAGTFASSSLLADCRNASLQRTTACPVPPHLHMTWKTENIPEVWQPYLQSCLAQHRHWNFTLWTDATARELVATHYPASLATYDSYPYGIQRADALRYFVLHRHGGVYLDLNRGCEAGRTLDVLRGFPFLLEPTQPLGATNDFIVAAAGHPFLAHVIRRLPAYNWHWLSPYLTVMASTGPLALSLMWAEMAPNERIASGMWLANTANGAELRGGHNPFHVSTFSPHGSTWHQWDGLLLRLFTRLAHAGWGTLAENACEAGLADATQPCAAIEAARLNRSDCSSNHTDGGCGPQHLRSAGSGASVGTVALRALAPVALVTAMSVVASIANCAMVASLIAHTATRLARAMQQRYRAVIEGRVMTRRLHGGREVVPLNESGRGPRRQLPGFRGRRLTE